MIVDRVVPVQLEAVALQVFWYHADRGEDRLELLKYFAKQTIERIDGWDRTEIRHKHESQHLAIADACFSCLTQNRKLYWHHVISIDHGGSNYTRNRLAVCYRCHAQIHPWLPPDRKDETRGGEWWNPAEIFDAVQAQAKATT